MDNNYKNAGSTSEKIPKTIQESEKIHGIDLMKEIEDVINRQIDQVKIYSGKRIKQ